MTDEPEPLDPEEAEELLNQESGEGNRSGEATPPFAETVDRQPDSDNSKLMTCPDCNRDVSGIANHCPHCGRAFNRSESSTSNESESTSPPSIMEGITALCAMGTIAISLWSVKIFVESYPDAESAIQEAAIGVVCVALSVIPYVITKSLWIIYDASKREGK